MCGIFGYVTTDLKLANSLSLDAAVKGLGHRGPDDSGTFNSTHGDVVCGFAHTRLSILDLSSNGHQPMTTEDGRYTIIYNGEVYNHKEVRDELEKLGRRFRSNCDTEVILEAYARWGKDCLSRFRGMFAFAVWDNVEGKLFMARDRLGIKPLYYSATPQGLLFGSEIRSLLATNLIDRKLSLAGLNSYLAFGSVTGPDTILDAVLSLKPGCWAEYHDGDLHISSYWSIPAATDEDVNYDTAIEMLHTLLRDAVSMRLVADVPVGIFLSGGIDSSAIVALAREATQSQLHTFTVTFDEREYNEAPFAAEVARLFATDHHQVHLSADQVGMEINSVVKALDQPSADGVNTYFVAKAARAAGLKVALSGLGGDEVFAGYSNFRRFGKLLKLTHAASLLPSFLAQSLLSRDAFNGSPNRLHKLAALVGTRGQPDNVYAVLRGMFLPQQRRALLAAQTRGVDKKNGLSWPSNGAKGTSGGIDSVNIYSVFELSNYLCNTLLRDADVMSMVHGLEVRVPLIDHLVVEQVARIPGRLKLDHGRNKPLLLDAAPSLPASIVQRKKMGFALPMGGWLRGALRPWVEHLLLGEPVKNLGFLDSRSIEKLWQSFLRGEQYTNFSRVWCLVALVAWCEENGVQG
jgi:asparagine synthase (glutamine-hydrolysing)